MPESIAPEKILVTGAAGFIGRHVMRALAERGHKAVGLSHADGDIAANPIDAPDDVTCLVHLAARTFVPKSWDEPADFYRVNVAGTVQALELAKRTKARFVFASTYVYGTPQSLPVCEDHPRVAVSPFHQSKIFAEDACTFYAAQFGIPVAIVRPFNVYGPGQVEPWLIPMLMRQALEPGPSITMDDLRPKRDYVFVGDVADMIVAIVERKATGAFNAASGQSTSMGELLEAMAQATGVRKEVLSRGKMRPNEILDLRGSIEKARRELGWSPKVGLVDGLRALKSVCENRDRLPCPLATRGHE